MPQAAIGIVISLIAVLFVFLFAVEKFSGQIERLAELKFKQAIQRFTETPFRGTMLGIILASILQSSTVVTVMLVSMVDAGIIPFSHTLGVIIGANFGTTITTQLVAFRLISIAPYILVIGFIWMKIRGRYQYLGKPIFYFGLIFSSLFVISVLASSFGNNDFLISLIQHTSNIFIAIASGFIIANIFQSSAAATSLIVIFAGGGLLNFDQAFGLVLGANIGTAITALVASLVTQKGGRRVAVANLVYNVFGVIVFLPFVGVFSNFVTHLSVDLPNQVALSNLFFNLIIAIIALILIKPFNRLIHYLVP